MFDVFYIGENKKLKSALPFAKQVESLDKITSRTKMHWVVEPNIEVTNPEIFEFRPPEHDQIYQHVWQWRENQFGGLRLMPAGRSAGVKEHAVQICRKRYDILHTPDPEDYFQQHPQAEHVWCIDADYKIDIESIDWTPPLGEENYIHNFKLPNQLLHKYVAAMGGINLYPNCWHSAGVKIHTECPFEDIKYPVYRVSHDKFTQQQLQSLADNTHNDWFWVVDDQYAVNGDFVFVPTEFEQQFIHVFKLPGQLEERYPVNIIQEWDNRCGGVWLVNRNFDYDLRKYQPNTVPVKYSTFYTDDVNNYAYFAERSRTSMFWLIDRDYVISDNINWLPQSYDQQYINIFKLHGQLEHKYPAGITNVSDNRCGGIKLIPKNYNTADVKYQGYLSGYEAVQFEQFTDEETGRANTQHDWFWVVDPTVDVLDDFDFDFVPEKWDEGKTHVWQKLNPITGRQYDYAGVMLCPKVPQAKGRPKYIREAACAQKEFPRFELDPQLDIIEQLVHIDTTVENSMYWVVDPFTRIHPDFKFDYYPTQWDQQNVHVFADEDGVYRNIRLYPRGTFANRALTGKDVANNSFANLKQINTVGSLRPQWPVVHLRDVTKSELVAALQEYANQEVPFLWTVDPDVSVEQSVLDAGYLPDVLSVNKVHVWQRQNPHTGSVHSYGGLRLWPTARDYSSLTTDQLRLNKVPNLQYVKQTGSIYLPYDIVFISYREPTASSAYKRLTARFPATWVKDVTGIFEAHKAAANSVNSKMFWVVDADADIVDTFDFGYIPDVYDQEVVHVWSSQNPVTGQEYGYGGVKLFNREQVLDATSWGLDFTTGLSSRFKAMPEVSCVTRFNTDEYSTWRSAFRECVKLSLKDDAESRERLEGWLQPVPDADFAHAAQRGAEEGCAYAQANINNLDALDMINNYEWLEQRYHNGV